jgi:hypothetical protein
LNKLARLFCLASIASLGCKKPTPAEQVDGVRSWLATAEMAAQAWVNHTTPEKYTRQTLELAGKNVEQIADELLKSPSPSVDSASLDSLLTQSSGRIHQMARFVTSRNAPEVRVQLDSLRAEETRVRDLGERLKPRQ